MSGFIFLMISTLAQTMTNASNVPMETSSPSSSRGKTPAAATPSTPTQAVARCGVLKTGWTLAKVAFAAGRLATLRQSASAEAPATLDGFIERRAMDLRSYWNEKYSRSYLGLVDAARAAAKSIIGGEAFVWAVARGAYKLMAYKDEYEVARLYSDGRFRSALAREFEDIRTLRFHLAPPLLSRIDPRSGRPRKITFGHWILPVFTMLSRFKTLRETPLDLFGWTAERKLERRLRDAYLKSMRKQCETLSADNLAAATNLALAPLDVRGFGPVKRPAAEALMSRLI